MDDKGDIFVTERLDREVKSKYHLRAKLFDTSNNLVEKVEEFVILVTDINDNDPVFTKSFNASIKERSKRGTGGQILDTRMIMLDIKECFC